LLSSLPLQDLFFQATDSLGERLSDLRGDGLGGSDDMLVEDEGLLEHAHVIAGLCFLDFQIHFGWASGRCSIHCAEFRLK
jgi:hypothetical protein